MIGLCLRIFLDPHFARFWVDFVLQILGVYFFEKHKSRITEMGLFIHSILAIFHSLKTINFVKYIYQVFLNFFLNFCERGNLSKR